MENSEIKDKIVKIVQIIGIIVVMGMFLLLFIMLIINESTIYKEGYKETKCYDRNNNEVINLSCKEEVRCGLINKWLDSCELK